MSKLYIFGIGGTGARVLKSLTMLLASGVKINASEIVPIIIDPDKASGDLTRTIELINKYKNIRKKAVNVNKETFFSTKINDDILPQITLPVEETSGKKFKDFIALDRMADSSNDSLRKTHALVSALFSESNFESTMDVGFKGNPNMGSVVLNQFGTSKEFELFANSFGPDDRIFIISSIFGGTGASGFPLLLKTLRSLEINGTEYSSIQESKIGGITVLPYFKLHSSDDSSIDSFTFHTKAKAALSYYENNLDDINSLYYIADDSESLYENNEGGANQKNKAHFVELASALAIIDFANEINFEKTIYKEFGIKKDLQQVEFSTLGEETRRIIERPLTQYWMFYNYLKKYSDITKPGNTYWKKKLKIDEVFSISSFYNDINSFNNDFFEWLKEMYDNKRSFQPFTILDSGSKLFNTIKSYNLNGSAYKKLDTQLNISYEKSEPKEELFVKLFFDATNRII